MLRSPLPKKNASGLRHWHFLEKSITTCFKNLKFAPKFPMRQTGQTNLRLTLRMHTQGQNIASCDKHDGSPSIWWIIYLFFQYNNFFSNSPMLVKNFLPFLGTFWLNHSTINFYAMQSYETYYLLKNTNCWGLYRKNREFYTSNQLHWLSN